MNRRTFMRALGFGAAAAAVGGAGVLASGAAGPRKALCGINLNAEEVLRNPIDILRDMCERSGLEFDEASFNAARDYCDEPLESGDLGPTDIWHDGRPMLSCDPMWKRSPDVIEGVGGECLAEAANKIEAACGQAPKRIIIGGESYPIKSIDGNAVTLAVTLKRPLRGDETCYLMTEA